jgi:hypothetical protein
MHELLRPRLAREAEQQANVSQLNIAVSLIEVNSNMETLKLCHISGHPSETITNAKAKYYYLHST